MLVPWACYAGRYQMLDDDSIGARSQTICALQVQAQVRGICILPLEVPARCDVHTA